MENTDKPAIRGQAWQQQSNTSFPENEFLQSRRLYLSGLPMLESGWIAGGGVVEGVAPSVDVCAIAVDLLHVLGSTPALKDDWTPRSLVMGPLTNGGVSMEFRLASLGAEITVLLKNDTSAELWFNHAGRYEELEAPISDAIAIITTKLGLQP